MQKSALCFDIFKELFFVALSDEISCDSGGCVSVYGVDVGVKTELARDVESKRSPKMQVQGRPPSEDQGLGISLCVWGGSASSKP